MRELFNGGAFVVALFATALVTGVVIGGVMILVQALVP